MRVLFLLGRVILYFFKKNFGFVNGGNIIYLFLLIIAAAPFFTIICTEMLLYSFPLILLLMYVVRITMSTFLFEEEDEQHEFFLRCCEISVWKMARMVYAYRYGHSLIILLYGLLFAYLNILDDGQKVQNEQYIKLCRSFSIRRYNCLLAKSRS